MGQVWDSQTRSAALQSPAPRPSRPVPPPSLQEPTIVSSRIALELLAVLLLVLLGGALALSEMAVVTARRSVLRQRAEDGDARARRALELAEAPGRFLSTVQIGITLVGILAGAFGGATLSGELAARLAGLGVPPRSAELLGVGLVVAGVTFLSLLLGELVPKRIALSDPERFAARVAPTMSRLARLAHPLVVVLNRSASMVLWLLRIRPAAEAPVTDEEIQVLLRQGAEAGIFEPIEEEIVGQLFRLSDRPVGALVTPRSEIVWLEPGQPDAEVLERFQDESHEHYPLAREDLDGVLGIVRQRDLLAQWLARGRLDLEAALRPALFLPERLPALEALERFREREVTMALVIDDHGGLVGLVTLNDVLGDIVRDLPEADIVERDVLRREDGTWLLDGMVALDELESLFDLAPLRQVHEGRYYTVGGWMMAALGRVPAAGDAFAHAGLRFEVMDMDGRRVDKVLVTEEPARRALEDDPAD